jgi:hypothetical protein
VSPGQETEDDMEQDVVVTETMVGIGHGEIGGNGVMVV